MYQDDEKYGWNTEPRQEPPKKKGGLFKKAALITAGALLFGSVSGAVMVGINVAASGFIKDSGIMGKEPASAKAETAPAPETVQRPKENNIYYGGPMDVVDIVEQTMPSVVAITSTAVYQTYDFGSSWFFGGGMGPKTYEIPSSGSGIIVGENEEELLIVTNNHVVEGSNSLKVNFIDNTVVDATIKGTDADTDLAVIAIDLDTIPAETRGQIKPAVLGDSDQLKVGQGVVAIGNALGYGQSVTVGYISALNREVQVSENSTRILLQTDAAINPGNSGGALLNMDGEVIGINAAKYSSTEVEGIGYAIPISGAQEIMGELMTRRSGEAVEEDKRGYLGIQGTGVDVDAEKTFGMPRGVYVYKILENGAAADTELREKDIITKVDGQTVRSMTDLQSLLAYYKAGEEIELTVQRQENGEYKEHAVTVKLKPMPKESRTTTGEE